MSIVGLVSCENEPPFVSKELFNVVSYESESLLGDSAGVFLSIHFVMYDENGIDDITDIHLINTDFDYIWKLKREELEVTQWQDDTYYGYSFFEYNNAKSVLLGNYLLRVFDKSGNITDVGMLVELDNVDELGEYAPEIPEYAIKLEDNKKGIRLDEFPYSSCEVRFPSELSKYKNSRKQFFSKDKIELSDKELTESTVISLRVNSEGDSRLVFFLKNYKV